MTELVVHLDAACARPPRLPSPFATPHPLAIQAARLVMARLSSFAEGKMFGALVVEDRDGRLGYLAAFSGMLAGTWYVDGFVPPLFDDDARTWWPAAEAELNELAAQIDEADARAAVPIQALAELDARHATAREELRVRHRDNRAHRRIARAEIEARTMPGAYDAHGMPDPHDSFGSPLSVTGAPGLLVLHDSHQSHGMPASHGPHGSGDWRGMTEPRDAGVHALDQASREAEQRPLVAHAAELHALDQASREAEKRPLVAHVAELHALDQASRGDAAEKRRLVAAHAAERAELARDVDGRRRATRALEEVRAAKSRDHLRALFDTYVVMNARGEQIDLRGCFAPDEPPGGAGDCVGPKLLGYAFREGLRPIALAEFWWGPAPATGGRHHGVFYPACRGKCGPLLARMLDGLAVDPPPVHERAVADFEIVVEDEWLAIVDKPCGLLSVPGKTVGDSVETRLARQWGEAFVVHRLDLDASGLLIVAKRRETHVELQRQFARREIEKRYVAWLDGVPSAKAGWVDLPIRVDPYDRPRQVVDRVHGKAALTEWRVTGTADHRARVELIPHTGRTHQLRLHAAHADGIGVPLVGDRLYGRPESQSRLLLHATALSFVHPHTKRRVDADRAAPF